VTEELQQAFFGIINGELPDRHGWLTFVYPEEAALREPAPAAAKAR
jgi:branched-chain amino acid aminotransferase